MLIKTTSCPNCGTTSQGRNAVVPMSPSYMNPRSPAPFNVSEGNSTNNSYIGENSEALHSNMEETKFKEGKILGVSLLTIIT